MHTRGVFCALVVLFLSLAMAAESTNPQVVGGAASFQQVNGNWNITTSNRAIINWNRFGIRQGNFVRFVQPGTSSAVLNRVLGNDVSRIDGSLFANGRVYLINRNGIVIGATGVVQTGGFVASTLDVENSEFMAGGNLRFFGASDAALVNMGQIDVLGGDVFLISSHVENNGTIRAPQGKVGLAAGHEVLLTQDRQLFVQATGESLGGTGVLNTGLIEATQAELRANGNLYALAINNTGVINATGVEFKEGRVLLTAEGGTVVNSGTITARTAGVSPAPGAGEDARAPTTGGEIQILGKDVRLEGNAVLDASGDCGGGKINVGGNAHGQGSLPNAETVFVGDLVRIYADALTSGDGGAVVVWADGSTDFRGYISAQALGARGDGGFAEVSGKVTLDYQGLADLRAVNGLTGTLLLDPTDFTINAAAATTIIANLAGANVVVATDSAGGGNGDLFINSAINYASANSLSLLAHRHIRANASVQNGGTGALNLVAGWDGVTGWSGGSGVQAGTFDLAAVLGNTASYGNSSGNISINNAASLTGVAVGSYGGATTVLGYDIGLWGSDTAPICFSQLGSRVNGATGSIRVVAKRDLTVMGGAHAESYALIGHGGSANGGTGIGGNLAGLIDVDVGGNLLLQGGGIANSYAQIGHGGKASTGAFSGLIDIYAQGDISLIGGTGTGCYAQIGHGGLSTIGDMSGKIDIQSVGNITLNSGSDGNTYAMIGHGGRDVDGDLSGNITVHSTSGDITLTADDIGSWVQIGNLTEGAARQVLGDITVITDGAGKNIRLDAVASDSGAHISNQATAMIDGDIVVRSNGGGVDLTSTADSRTVIGNFGRNSLCAITGDTQVFGETHVSLSGGTGLYGIALIGGGCFGGGARTGDITVASHGNVSLTAGTGQSASAQIGYHTVDGTNNGNVSVDTANLTLTGGGEEAYAQIGHGGFGCLGNATGTVTVNATGDLSLTGGAQEAYAQIGHGGLNADGNRDGNINISAVGNIRLDSGNGSDGDAMIGHGGQNSEGDSRGDITVHSTTGDIRLTADDVGGVAWIGHEAEGAACQVVGDITVMTDAAGINVQLDANASNATACIGLRTHALADGDITVTSNGGGVALRSVADSYTFIGHTYSESAVIGTYSFLGDIRITGQQYVSLTAGSGAHGVAVIGNVPYDRAATCSGNITITSQGDVSLTGGSGDSAFAQIGFVGLGGSVSGNIEVDAKNLAAVGKLFKDPS